MCDTKELESETKDGNLKFIKLIPPCRCSFKIFLFSSIGRNSIFIMYITAATCFDLFVRQYMLVFYVMYCLIMAY